LLYDTRDTVAGCRCRRCGGDSEEQFWKVEEIKVAASWKQTGGTVRPSAGLGAVGDEALGSLEL
jgi:hypothetical protein